MLFNQPWLRNASGVTSTVQLWWDIEPIFAGLFGVLFGFAVIFLLSFVTPKPGQQVQDLVEHIRSLGVKRYNPRLPCYTRIRRRGGYYLTHKEFYASL